MHNRFKELGKRFADTRRSARATPQSITAEQKAANSAALSVFARELIHVVFEASQGLHSSGVSSTQANGGTHDVDLQHSFSADDARTYNWISHVSIDEIGLEIGFARCTDDDIVRTVATIVRNRKSRVATITDTLDVGSDRSFIFAAMEKALDLYLV